MLLQTKAKIVKKDGSAPTELESRIAAELANLEANNAALKADLKNLHINAAREVELEGGRKSVLVFVPFPLLADFRKIQKTLIEELEKKLGGSHVLIIANRTMISGQGWARNTKLSGVRPRSRTLKAVQEALLDDIVFPAEITGKRIRVRVDGSRLLKVGLSAKDSTTVEAKLDTFKTVYGKLTHKAVEFSF